MSDLFIPGINNRYGTDELVENLMKVERIPKERAEKNVETQKEIKTHWQEVGRRISSLREAARTLYSFQNPFNDRIGVSADESVVTLSPTRQADEQKRRIEVHELARADRFLSRPLDSDHAVPAGDYAFSIGEELIEFPYRGGTIKNFVDTINRRGADRLKASLISVQAGSPSLLIESLKTGTENRLGFQGAALDLAIETGLVASVDSREERPSLDPQSLAPVSRSEARTGLSLSEGVLSFSPGTEARIPIQKTVKGGEDLVLSYRAQALAIEEGTQAEPEAPQGPGIPDAGSVQYGGISIENAPLSIDIPEWHAPPPPPRVDTDTVLYVRYSDNSREALPALPPSEDFTAFDLPLSRLATGKTITGIDVINRNTHRSIALTELRIHDPAASGNIKPLNPVETASDARLSLDGIALTRPTNNIEDLIPGTTVQLKGTSTRPVDVAIEPDREGAKNSIIALVGNYNRLMIEMNVLLRNDESILRELDYLAKDEIDDLREKMGAFQGDSSLNQLRASLQSRVSTAYPTAAERELALVAQIGISTNAAGRGQGGGYDASRLRGYLEIDEKSLDKALEGDIASVAQLFGNDSDQDRIIDTGFALELDKLARAWVETGGILALKTSGLDTRISREEDRIKALDEQLADKEMDLKRKYGMMEGTLNRMQGTSKSIEQFSSNNAKD